MVYSGFPGIGKTYLTKLYPHDYIDSDSSRFPKDQFPANYISYIKTVHQRYNLLVSSHDVVRAELVACNIPFTLVYPGIEQKAEYLERYKERGNTPAFLDMMDKGWDTYIRTCLEQKGCLHIKLESGMYLKDILFI